MDITECDANDCTHNSHHGTEDPEGKCDLTEFDRDLDFDTVQVYSGGEIEAWGKCAEFEECLGCDKCDADGARRRQENA